MKAKIGMRVRGECDSGVIVVMTPQWCIYRDDAGAEIAETWEFITAEIDSPDSAEGGQDEHEIEALESA